MSKLQTPTYIPSAVLLLAKVPSFLGSAFFVFWNTESGNEAKSKFHSECSQE